MRRQRHADRWWLTALPALLRQRLMYGRSHAGHSLQRLEDRQPRHKGSAGLRQQAHQRRREMVPKMTAALGGVVKRVRPAGAAWIRRSVARC